MRLQTVYSPNLPLCALKTAEVLLVTSVRLFLFAPQPMEAACPWWEGLWRATGDFQAAAAFEQLLRIVEMASIRPLDMRCPCSHELGEDEGRLLQLIALYQHKRPEAAMAVLAQWLPPDACRVAVAPASDLARLLGRSKLVVPWRCTQDGFPHGPHSDPGLALVQ